MTTFERTINGVNYDIVCKSWETRYSWGHECRIYKGYKQLTSARCRYYNRTWESFQYQSVAISAIWNVLAEVKQNLLCEILDEKEHRSPSYGEFAEVDEIISDEEVFAAYDGTEFSEGDFWCNCE